MTIASQADTATQWAATRAIDLWIAFDDAPALAPARSDGAIVVGASHESPFAIFAAMQEHGIDDVRRVGVLASRPGALDAARRAGSGAVVAVASSAAEREILRLSEPDAIVGPGEAGALDTDLYARNRQLRPRVLLNPGPALTTDRVKRSAARADLCHREPEYRALERRVRERLRAVAGVDDRWGVALVAASGTGADETALAASVREGRRLLVLRNGVYGERLWDMAAAHGIAATPIDAGWTEAIEAPAVAAALAADPSIDAVAMVHHETTTGLLNPLAAIAEVTRAAGVRLVVDAISSFGAEPIELAASGIDLLVCSSNKCLHGLPGVGFVLASPEGAQRAAEAPRRSVYLGLAGYLAAARSESVPFTPAIPAVLALDAALGELLERGLERHQAAYAARAAVLDATFERLGLEPLLAPEVRSRSIRTARLPHGVEFGELHDRLRADGYVIYAGQGPLAREAFRVACMGALEPAALDGFAARLEVALSALGAVPA